LKLKILDKTPEEEVMGKIFDRLKNAIANVKKHTPAVGAALQSITTNLDTLENQIQQMQAQKPAIQTQLQSAAHTVQALKLQVHALVSALQTGNAAASATGTPPAQPSAASTASGSGS
jgi:septal ring factor EnvC (AmiA/AmiB activator)